MINEKEFSFVRVHFKHVEWEIYGYITREDRWLNLIRMKNNDSEDGRAFNIAYDEIRMIEHMPLEEAPWNE